MSESKAKRGSRRGGRRFIPMDYRVLDFGLDVFLGKAWLVYARLWRIVWRSTTSGQPAVVKAVRNGEVVARISQQTIAGEMSRTNWWVCRRVRELKDLGLVQIHPTSEKGEVCNYLLGYRQSDGNERLFLHDMLDRVEEKVKQYCRDNDYSSHRSIPRNTLRDIVMRVMRGRPWVLEGQPDEFVSTVCSGTKVEVVEPSMVRRVTGLVAPLLVLGGVFFTSGTTLNSDEFSVEKSIGGIARHGKVKDASTTSVLTTSVLTTLEHPGENDIEETAIYADRPLARHGRCLPASDRHGTDFDTVHTPQNNLPAEEGSPPPSPPYSTETLPPPSLDKKKTKEDEEVRHTANQLPEAFRFSPQAETCVDVSRLSLSPPSTTEGPKRTDVLHGSTEGADMRPMPKWHDVGIAAVRPIPKVPVLLADADCGAALPAVGSVGESGGSGQGLDTVEASEASPGGLAGMPIPGRWASDPRTLQVVDEVSKRHRAELSDAAKRGRVAELRRQNLRGKRPSRELLRLEERWFEGVRQFWPDTEFAAWGPREYGQVRGLLGRYSHDVVELLLEYASWGWRAINARYFKGAGTVPTVGMVVKMHDLISPEAQRWGPYREAHKRYERGGMEVEAAGGGLLQPISRGESDAIVVLRSWGVLDGEIPRNRGAVGSARRRSGSGGGGGRSVGE